MRYIHLERVYIQLTGTDAVRFVLPVDGVRKVEQSAGADFVTVVCQLAAGEPLQRVEVAEAWEDIIARLEFAGGGVATHERVARWNNDLEESERKRAKMEEQIYAVGDIVSPRRRRPD